MKIRRVASFKLRSADQDLLIDRRHFFIGAGAFGIVGPGLIFAPGAAQAQLSVARYLFQLLTCPAAVKISESVLASCVMFNAGKAPTRAKLTGTLRGDDGSIEDQDSANLAFDPGEVQTFSLEFEPDDEGPKTVSCRTPNDSRSARVIVRS
jgi:hypothetical protein